MSPSRPVDQVESAEVTLGAAHPQISALSDPERCGLVAPRLPREGSGICARLQGELASRILVVHAGFTLSR